MSHIFISYSRQDMKFVETLKKRLEEAEFSVWFDKHSIESGDDWGEAIDQGINGAFVVLVVLTEDSIKSHYVTYEWSYALGAKKTVIPILLRLEDRSKIHSRLSKLQTRDFREVKQGSRIWQSMYDDLRKLEYDVATKDILPPDNASDELINLIRVLNDPAPDKRKVAIDALGKRRKEDATQALIQVLQQDQSEKVRDAAVKALRKLRGTAATTAIIEALKNDTSPWVRKAAAYVLQKMGDTRQDRDQIYKALRAALKDHSKMVHDTAATAIDSIKSQKTATIESESVTELDE